MASRAAILRAAQAAPGAVQPAAPPQGGSPWPGRLPGYSPEPGSGYSRPYGPFLPRPPETFTQGAFGPFSPILPVPVDQPPEGFHRAQPRRWQPYVGYNLPVGQPGSEGYKLASFATLKTLSETYSVLRTCLERRKNEIRALDWDIVPTEDAAKAYQGDRKAWRDFGERRGAAMKFFRRPDSDYEDFGSWLHALTDQLFVYDAVSVYLSPKKGRGLGRGLLGSDLDELWLVDGSSIRPLAGLHGERPRPPAPCYQQYEFGVPRADLTTIVAGMDLDGSEGALRQNLRGDQLTYRPYLRRADSPYGFSLVEQAIIPIMTGLRKQAYQLDFFSEGTVPRVYISPGDTTMTPNQIRELQDALNAVAGDLAWAFKIQVLPPGSKVMPQKEMAIVDDADNWIATEVSMVCDVSPVELGLLPKVSAMASPFAAREAAQASRSVHERTATKPTLNYLVAIPDMVLQVICGMDDMRFIFSGMEQTQDVAALTDVGVKQVQSGVISIDEFRADLKKPPWGLPETSSPVVFTQLGPVPLAQAAMDTVAQQQQALTGAHDAARGGAGRRALPAGTSGQGRMNGPVTQRQARRGGALAPAHAMAEGSPGHSGASSPKAAAAELEALGRHLRKGRPVAEWVPQHVTATMLACISEDVGNGLPAAEAIRAAAASLPKARQNPRQQQAAIAAQYQPRVQAAFGSAVTQAQGLIAAWITGTLAVTAAVLASLIADLIRAALLGALTALWTAAWDAGAKAAAKETGKPAPGSQAALEAFLATHGQNWASLISGTGMAALLAAIAAALAAGDPGLVLARLRDILNAGQRPETIAVSETGRAWNAGYLDALKEAGVAYKQWRDRGDAKVCASCRAKTAMGPVPLLSAYPDGTIQPPGHPKCRCHLETSAPPRAPAAKVLRREAGLNGQETQTGTEPGQDFSGGRVFQPHRSDGTQDPQGGVPGQGAGGEPPRWDGTEPDPVTERAPDADDDAEYGQAAGAGARPGTCWPAPYMDGWFPSPAGHGTTQPSVSSPGGRNGRPPNAAGKGRRGQSAAAFARSAPAAKPAAVRAVMRQNFPPEALAWVGRIRWSGPADMPVGLIDLANDGTWAASHQQGHVDDLARQMKDGHAVNPVIAVVRPGHKHARLIDGRHRTLAARKLGRPVTAYVGWLDDANEKAAYGTYHHQHHAGDSPQNKSFTAGNDAGGSAHGLVPFNLQSSGKLPKGSVRYRAAAGPSRSCGSCSMFIAGGSCTLVAGDIEAQGVCDRWEQDARQRFARGVRDRLHATGGTVPPVAAGVAVRAAGTGRVLMIQRALSDGDRAAGRWEFPGGGLEPGETPMAAAVREWAEETGVPLPPGEMTGHWESTDGRYHGFVLTIGSESGLPIFGDRDQVSNPDDPDGDQVEAIAWWEPRLLGGNPAVRGELLADLPLVQAALAETAEKSARPGAEILREYWTHTGHPGPTQYALEQKIRWGEKGDWYRCVEELTPYLGAEGSQGYCNLRHHEVLGAWPGRPV